MPTHIYNFHTRETVTGLSDSWELPDQIDALNAWLEKEGKNLPKSSYVADIGFSVLENATGGGGVLTSRSMEIMGQIGMDVYFSEYQLHD